MNNVIDDLISRAAAIEAFDDERVEWNYGDVSPESVIKVIESIPAADATPVVRGRWVKMTGMMPPEYHGHYECSECGWHMKGLRNSWTREEELNYCPNCGAKMESEHNMNETTIGHWLDGSDDLPPIGGFHE